MNCQELKDQLPLFLSGERAGEAFDHHLRSCGSCGLLVDRQRLADERLRAVLLAETPSADSVQKRIRLQIAVAQKARFRTWQWAGIAAMVAAVCGAAIWLAVPPRAYADAARDHQVEVVQKQPRRWLTGPELSGLVSRSGLTNSSVAHLAPAGYWLQHGKNCGLDGQRTLHLVFTDGVREVSLFLRQDPGQRAAVRNREIGNEHLAGFHTVRFAAIVVSESAEADCLEFSHAVAKTL